MGVGFSTELGKDSLLEDTKHKLDDALQQLRVNDPATISLDLSNCGIAAQGMEIGATSLATNSYIQELDLSYNQLGAEGVSALVDSLKRSVSLVKLNLAGNHISDEGCKVIGEWLETATTIEELSLYHNQISDKGACYLANALQRNTSLHRLNLNMNELSNASLIMFSKVFAHNQSLMQLDWKCNNNFDFKHDPNKYEGLQHQIDDALASNGEVVDHKKSIIKIKNQKEKRRLEKEAEDAANKARSEEEERKRLEGELKALEEQKRKEEDEIRRFELEMAKKRKRIEESRQMLDPSVKAEKARQWAEKAMVRAYEWRDKVTNSGNFVKEWRNGFTVMSTMPGDKPGAAPTVSAEAPRRLKACWCDPQDATAPYAKQLHYHCKYEKEPDAFGHDDGEVPKYCACQGSGHTCSSVGFFSKPLPDLTAAHFFASPPPEQATELEE